MHTIGTPLMWTVFTVLILVALAVDFLVLQRNGAHRVSTREALLWSIAWIALALLFNLGLWWYLHETLPAPDAHRIAMEFFTGYLVEKALAVDNIFVFLMIFGYFAVPAEQQQRALIIGIIGAIVLRGILILIGAALIAQFHWILYVFGVFLLLTGAKMLFSAGDPPDLNDNPALKWMRRHLRLTDRFHGNALRVTENGVRRFTPLFVVMALIAVTDVIFAVDSIPAIFAITTDPFIVLTSNVFAVLGLRALYFLLAGMAEKFHLLGHGLALVLIFIGSKMLIMDVYKIPIGIALGVVAALVGGAMLLSVLRPKKEAPVQPPGVG
ncbi:TerC family protein [Coralloluteibacterium thermophilus]|uniref:TerC family protein n=1 Tax=Coralloluteibacterium thermophilum TaxID=2707049 RepID=A0ABV9NLE9_9GAMM